MQQQEDWRQEAGASGESFEFLANQVPDFIWMTGPEGIEVTYSNKPFLDFLGLSSVEEFLGTAWEQHIHPDDLATVLRVYGNAHRKKMPYNLEARFRPAKSVQYQWLLIHGMPRFDRTGTFTGFIGTAMDLSIFKKVQMAIGGEQLDRTEAMTRRINSLEQSNEDLLSFARVTSHDLRQPVRKVQLYLGMFRTELQKGITNNALVYLGKAQNAADRMAVMIDGILRYSLMDGDAVEDVIHLDRLFDQITGDLEVIIREKDAVVEYSALPTLTAQPIMIYQLFYNLVSNALKFSKKDQPPHVRVTGNVIHRSDGDFVRVSVKDNGIGFRIEDAHRMFEEFVRLDDSHPEGGKGIGLALCKKIVRRHGGKIEAKSHADGAEFIVSLPCPAS